MRLILVVLATAIWAASATVSAVVAETGSSAQTKPTLLKSEEEIWEYLEQLCKEAPTQRCESMQFLRVRDGEIIPMENYNEEEAYHGKEELIEAARAILNQQSSEEDS